MLLIGASSSWTTNRLRNRRQFEDFYCEETDLPSVGNKRPRTRNLRAVREQRTSPNELNCVLVEATTLPLVVVCSKQYSTVSTFCLHWSNIISGTSAFCLDCEAVFVPCYKLFTSKLVVKQSTSRAPMESLFIFLPSLNLVYMKQLSVERLSRCKRNVDRVETTWSLR